ncbi:uncharacterized protein LOC116113476 [Pistacia vera]|uniref:uncharacterized protein LOC116113476 n=1 Tax=Pistacia vera TaxID=55513 RepID=UPI001262CFA0|nr:uncharacterized protein LOC116113476 [Pistacia vera]
MEECLQYMKTLRHQMNEVEDQTTKVTVEEQMLITIINSMENDLVSVFASTKLLREEAEKMNKEKGQICAQILAKQRKISSLESDSSTLNQTMELIQQERVSSSKKLAVKKNNIILSSYLTFPIGKCSIDNNNFMDNKRSEARKTLMANLVFAEYKLDEIAQKTLKPVQENKKMNDSFEQVKCRANKLKAEMLAMDIKTLEEDHTALLSDKVGESEFWECLKDQIEQVKGLSYVLNCDCGEEYKVEVNL